MYFVFPLLVRLHIKPGRETQTFMYFLVMVSVNDVVSKMFDQQN